MSKQPTKNSLSHRKARTVTRDNCRGCKTKLPTLDAVLKSTFPNVIATLISIYVVDHDIKGFVDLRLGCYELHVRTRRSYHMMCAQCHESHINEMLTNGKFGFSTCACNKKYYAFSLDERVL